MSVLRCLSYSNVLLKINVCFSGSVCVCVYGANGWLLTVAAKNAKAKVLLTAFVFWREGMVAQVWHIPVQQPCPICEAVTLACSYPFVLIFINCRNVSCLSPSRRCANAGWRCDRYGGGQVSEPSSAAHRHLQRQLGAGWWREDRGRSSVSG